MPTTPASDGDFARAPAGMLRLPCVLAGITLLVAVANVVILHVASAEWLAGYRFGFMAVMTATAFALLGGSLLLRLLFPEAGWAQVTAWVGAALVAAIGITAFIGRTTGHSLPWEVWLESSIPVKVPFQMLHTTTVLLMFSSFSLWSLTRGESRLPWVKEMGVVSACIVALLGFLSVVSSTAGNPILSRTEPLNVSQLTAVSFCFFNCALVLSVSHTGRLRRLFFGVYEVEDLPPLLRNDRTAFGVLGLSTLVILAGIVFYLRIETAQLRRRVGAELQVAAELKADQLTAWRQERLNDARAFADMPDLPRILASLKSGQAGPERHDELIRWLKSYARIYNYERVVLLDATLTPVLTGAGGISPTAAYLEEQLRAATTGQADLLILPPYADENNELRLDFLALLPRPAGHAPVGAVLLQSKPSKTILPMLQVWPYGNQTGQFVLFRREGNRLYSLGGVRAQAGLAEADQRPFSVTRSLDDPTTLIARGAAGEPGLLEGLDLRGIPVVGLGRLIPYSDWVLICRMDASEIYAPLRRSAWQVVGLTLLVFGGIGFFLTRRLRHQQLDLHRERVVAELAQKRTAARLGAVMEHARDVMLILDTNLRIIEANQCAIDTYGWKMEELCRMRARDLRSAASRPDFEQVAARVAEVGGGSFETEHRRKDGSVFPVEVSTSRVEIDRQPHFFSIIRDISERKHAEADLRASEERYRLIAENTSDIIWLYDLPQDGFSYVSAAALPVLGYHPKELLGARLSTTLTDESARQAGQVLQQLLADLESGGKRQHTVVELEQRHKDGRLIQTEVTSSLLPGPSGRPTLLLGITRDITERQQARETLVRFNAELEQRVTERTAELAANQKLLRTLVDNIQTVIFMKDRTGRYLLINPHYEQVTGIAAGAILGRTDLDVMPPAIAGPIMAQDRRVMESGQPLMNEETVPSPDGSERHYLSIKVPLFDEQEQVYGMCGISSDITSLKKAERDITANLERERQLSEMKSRFVSVASHEFRTPLAAAMGSLELLEKHLPRLAEQKRNELFARTRGSLNRLAAIIGSVLSLSRADSGRVTVKRMSVDLGRFVRDIVQEAETADRSQHPITVQQSPGPETVPADTNLLHHIISNLLGNAVRYSPAGSPITLALAIDTAQFTVTVADDGIGVPPEERATIFEPFMRGSNVGQIGGTGLGLNIVKRYTELMGGRIELLDTVRGASFRVTVPLIQPTSPSKAPFR